MKKVVRRKAVKPAAEAEKVTKPVEDEVVEDQVVEGNEEQEETEDDAVVEPDPEVTEDDAAEEEEEKPKKQVKRRAAAPKKEEKEEDTEDEKEEEKPAKPPVKKPKAAASSKKTAPAAKSTTKPAPKKEAAKKEKPEPSKKTAGKRNSIVLKSTTTEAPPITLDDILNSADKDKIPFAKREQIIALTKQKLEDEYGYDNLTLALVEKFIKANEEVYADLMDNQVEFNFMNSKMKVRTVEKGLRKRTALTDYDVFVSRDYHKYVYQSDINKPKPEENIRGTYDEESGVFTTDDGDEINLA
jgi:hypothetical protein